MLLCGLLAGPTLAQDVTLTEEEKERIYKALPRSTVMLADATVEEAERRHTLTEEEVEAIIKASPTGDGKFHLDDPEEIKAFLDKLPPELRRKLTTRSQQAKQPATKFLRISRDKRGRAMTLDTAIVRYVRKPDAQLEISPAPGEVTRVDVLEPTYVDLVGAVHVGETFYYRELNKQFKEYEVLLYELVAEKGKTPADRGQQPNENPVGAMQGMMTKMLGLQHQTDGIDYSAPNFVHADMSPAELKARMQQRGESPMVYFLEVMANSLRQQQKPQKGGGYQNPEDTITDEELLMALVQGFLLEQPSPILKRYLALQFDDLETQMKAFSGGLGRLIITDRNKACFKVLDEQLAAGKTQIGIFYGAGHLPDMEKRLLKRGFEREGVVWVEAWLLR